MWHITLTRVLRNEGALHLQVQTGSSGLWDSRLIVMLKSNDKAIVDKKHLVSARKKESIHMEGTRRWCKL